MDQMTAVREGGAWIKEGEGMSQKHIQMACGHKPLMGIA